MRASVAGCLATLLVLSALTALAVRAAAWEIDATATVTLIVDGDTFDGSPTGRTRLADIDAPEYYEDGYQEAKDFLASLIDGRTVYLDIDDVYGTDVYNRTVAVVYVRYDADHLQNVNKALLDSGWAVIWDFNNEFDPSAWTTLVDYPAGPAPLQAEAWAISTKGTAPFTVQFTVTVSGGTPPYSFDWNFGDGSNSSIQSPSHTYEFAGSYQARITAADANGNASSASLPITATAPAPPPPAPSPPPPASPPTSTSPTDTGSSAAALGFVAASVTLGIVGTFVLLVLRRRQKSS